MQEEGQFRNCSLLKFAMLKEWPSSFSKGLNEMPVTRKVSRPVSKIVSWPGLIPRTLVAKKLSGGLRSAPNLPRWCRNQAWPALLHSTRSNVNVRSLRAAFPSWVAIKAAKLLKLSPLIRPFQQSVSRLVRGLRAAYRS